MRIYIYFSKISFHLLLDIIIVLVIVIRLPVFNVRSVEIWLDWFSSFSTMVLSLY